MKTPGKRQDYLDGGLPQPGEYGRSAIDHWYGCPPDQDADEYGFFLIGALDKHQVVEHEDGTITVSPSILIAHRDGKSWHGYLVHGEWTTI